MVFATTILSISLTISSDILFEANVSFQTNHCQEKIKAKSIIGNRVAFKSLENHIIVKHFMNMRPDSRASTV